MDQIIGHPIAEVLGNEAFESSRHYFERAQISAKVMESAIESMKSNGAIIIDPVEIPSQGKSGDADFEVLLYEFKDGLNRYLAGCGGEPAARTLQELIDFNERNRDRELPYFGQETFLKAQDKGPLTDEAYRNALEKTRRLARAEGIDAVMDQHRLDAIVAPTTGPAHVTDLTETSAERMRIVLPTRPALLGGTPAFAAGLAFARPTRRCRSPG